MPRINLLFALLLASKISFPQEATTADTKTLFNERIIEYKWGEGQFVNVMPFDDPFVIKITGMPPDLDTINLTLYEVRGNYKLFFKTKNSISYDEFKAMPVIKRYTLAPWKRPRGSLDTFAYLLVPYHLKPNSKYVIEIQSTKRAPLDSDEEEEVRVKIQESKSIRDLITNTARKYIGTDRSFKKITDFMNEFNKTVIKELKELNENYHFEVPTDEEEQLRQVTRFIESLQEVYSIAEQIAEDTSNKNVSTAAELIKTFDATSFGEFIFDKQNQKKIESLIKALDITGQAESVKANIIDIKEHYENVISLPNKIVAIIVENIIINNTYLLIVLGSNYPLNMTDQADRYIGLDMGVAYIGNFSRYHTYYGLNIYLRPVNKNIPLSRYKNFGDFMLTRTSILLGVTFSSVNKENIRKGILGDKGVILGAGFRIVSFFRINAGGLLYYRYPTNPLQDSERYSARVSPFMSLSFDLDMEELLGAVGKSIFPAKTVQ